MSAFSRGHNTVFGPCGGRASRPDSERGRKGVSDDAAQRSAAGRPSTRLVGNVHTDRPAKLRLSHRWRKIQGGVLTIYKRVRVKGVTQREWQGRKSLRQPDGAAGTRRIHLGKLQSEVFSKFGEPITLVATKQETTSESQGRFRWLVVFGFGWILLERTGEEQWPPPAPCC